MVYERRFFPDLKRAIFCLKNIEKTFSKPIEIHFDTNFTKPLIHMGRTINRRQHRLFMNTKQTWCTKPKYNLHTHDVCRFK